MVRRRQVAPLALLQPQHALARDDVRPGAVQARRLVRAVEVYEQLARRGLARHALVEVHHPLVLALHEVDLDPLHAPPSELVERGLHLQVEGLPHDPHDQAHVLLLRVGGQRLHVEAGGDREQVAERVPAFVQDDVLQAVLGGEVDVVLVGVGVDAGLERHAREVEVVPPVPRHLARRDPGRVRHGRLAGQAEDDVGREQVRIALGEDQDAPGEVAGPARLRQVRLALDDLLVAIVRLLDLLRVRGEQPLQRARLRPRLQVHSRVVEEVRFRDDRLRAAAENGHGRQRGELAGLEFADLQPLVLAFLVRLEARLLGEPQAVVAREGEGGVLPGHGDVAGQFRHPSVRGAVVVGTHEERVSAREVHAPLVEPVADLRALGSHDRLQRAVDGLSRGTGDDRRAAEDAPSVEGHREA